MNDLVHNMAGGGTPARMTSREIAELLGARHDNVRRAIERLADKAVIQLPPTEEVKNHLGQTISEYVFEGESGKRDSYIVVAQLSPEFTARLVDRWQELEARPVVDPMVALSDPAIVRSLLLTYSEKVIAMQPKADAYDRLVTADGSLCLTDAAKSLGVRPKNLIDYLRSHGWVYTPPGGRGHIAYAAKLQQGLMEHKITTVNRADGSEKVVTQARVTPKGLTRLAQAFPAPARAA